MLGQFIDGLSNEQRDRIIRGQRWITESFYHKDLGRCLLGYVFDVRDSVGYDTLEKRGVLTNPYQYDPIAKRFDNLCQRFGKDRIVRAIKKRAGANLDIGDVADADVTDSREPATANA